MERFSQRESVVLGYNNLPRPLMNMNQFSSSKPGKPFRHSDVDFHDVFGGPPRRFSMQEHRPVYGVIDDDDDHVDGDGGGKPVFGDEGGAGRRKLPSADFFNDIFGGDAAANSPKRYGRDGSHVFPASPGSRALSPLPPQADPFLSSSPFTQFSLPAKVGKVQEIPTFGGSSGNSSSNSSPSRNSQSKLKDGSPNGAISLSRFSAELNRPAEKNLGESRPLFTTEEEEYHRLKNSKDSEALLTSTNVNGHFHFSIYKWAGKSHVPLDIPLRAKKGASSRLKVDVAKSEQFSATEQIVNDGDDNNKTAKTNLADLLSSSSPLDEVIEEEEETPTVVAKDDPAKGIAENKEEAQKPEVKSVNSLFYDDFERGLNEKKMDKSTKLSSSPSVGYTKTTKKQDRKNTPEFENVNRGITFSPRREHNGKSRVKGKVLEFVKIFNQEPSAKISREGLMSRSRSCKWNDKCTFEDDEKIDSPREEEKLSKPKSNEDLKQSAKVHASVHDNSTPSADAFSDCSKVTTEESADESLHDNFQVKELIQDENGQLESVTRNQEFQEIDAKIRQWTKGKEGNIRSLLSTLQFVLWVESGWKAVPLVDIIEGNAVKRAYQRALLCLHPDKLQQKGASSQQKYLAEKVFDILQEAWNYFNSLGAI